MKRKYSGILCCLLAAALLVGILPHRAAAVGQPIPITQDYFPDPAFCNFLKDGKCYDQYIDTDRNGLLDPGERSAVSSLEMVRIGLTDVTGIQYFPGLMNLDISNNKVQMLDLSQNPELECLTCVQSQLTDVNLKGNPRLSTLIVAGNQLDSLDIRYNPHLMYLNCAGNFLTYLDLSSQRELDTLYCNDNRITDLDLTPCPKLWFAECEGNLLKQVDLRRNPKVNTIAPFFQKTGEPITLVVASTPFSPVFMHNTAGGLSVYEDIAYMERAGFSMDPSEGTIQRGEYGEPTFRLNPGVRHAVVDTRLPLENGQVLEESFVLSLVDLHPRVTFTWVPRMEPTCTEPGELAHYLGSDGNCYLDDSMGHPVVVAPESLRIPPTGHIWAEPQYTWTHDTAYHCTATRTCPLDSITETAHATVTSRCTREPTDSMMGETTYTAVFAEDWAMEQQKVVEDIPVRSRHKVFVQENLSHGTVLLNSDSLYTGEKAEVTVYTDPGYTLNGLQVSTSSGAYVEVTRLTEGSYCFTMPDEDVVVYADIMPAASGFVDVKPSDYFYAAVNWAVANGITVGSDGTHFAPGAPCIRKQVVMFLWRACGRPEPASMVNPFVDVPHNVYEKAILWAYYAGITSGKDASHFQPEKPCSREQIVMFLWRANGKPEPVNMDNPFRDVGHGVFEKPILWAVQNGITSGTTAETFQPKTACTRAQIVSFLYRNAMVG